MRTVIEYMFSHEGLECAVVATPLGHRCGYVGVPKSHPLHKKDYTLVNVDVHGGLTYSGDGANFLATHKETWWFGYDCAHFSDAKDPSIMSPEYRLLDSIISNDFVYRGTIWTKKMCIDECKKLAEQLSKYTEKQTYLLDSAPMSRRAEILGIQNEYPYGGICHFEGATVEQIKTLIDEGFLNPDGCQNNSPTAQDFYDFMVKYPTVKAHGYVVSPDRDDCRVTIEGIMLEDFERTSDTLPLLKDFIELCGDADSLTLDGSLYSWWD